jgi:hypothetical protein
MTGTQNLTRESLSLSVIVLLKQYLLFLQDANEESKSVTKASTMKGNYFVRVLYS